MTETIDQLRTLYERERAKNANLERLAAIVRPMHTQYLDLMAKCGGKLPEHCSCELCRVLSELEAR